MRTGSIVLLGALALVAGACGTEVDDPPTAPTETVTGAPVEDPDEGEDGAASPPAPSPSPSPSPTTEVTAAPDDGVSVCDDVAAGEGDSLAFVFVERPSPGAEVTSGFEVSGCANAFEATYEWELLDREQNELASGFGTATCGSGCVGDFSFTVDYTVGEFEVGTLRVFTTSAQDGSVQDLNAIPLRLTP